MGPLTAGAALEGFVASMDTGTRSARSVGQGMRVLAARMTACGVPWVALALPVAVTALSLMWLQFSALSLRQPATVMTAAVFLVAAGGCAVASLAPWGRYPAAVLGLFAVVFGGFAATSLPSALGVAMGWPLWDQTLLAVDRALGFDHPWLLDGLVQYPWAVNILRSCYTASVPMVLLAGLVLIALKRFDRLAEFKLLFALTIVVVVGSSAFFTAAGLLVDLPVSDQVRAVLPREAGIYHMGLFEVLRSGHAFAYAPGDNPGIVTFPSFHTCMALLVWYGLRDDPALKVPAIGYCVLTIVSTVPIGGHYVADLIAGAAVFAACAGTVAMRRGRADDALGRELEAVAISGRATPAV